MNATVFGRIFWKEYRTQRSFWISMVLAMVIVELILWANPWIPRTERTPVLFGLALSCAALYVLGSAATLFAAEHENGTYDLLRALPVTSLKVFVGKIVFALGSAAAMYLVAWTLALMLDGELPDPREHLRMWTGLGLGGVEILAWGIFFSLLLQRALVAAIVAGIAGSSVPSICFYAAHLPDPPSTLLGRILILVPVMAADIALSARWFRERALRPARRRRQGLSEPEIEAILDKVLPVRASKVYRKSVDVAPSAATMLGRLVWQEFRQSVVVAAAMFAVFLPSALYLWMQWIFGFDSVVKPDEVFAASASCSIFTSALLGSSVFLADQTGCRFRFLAERGIPPRLVWLSRQIRGSMVVLLGLLLVLSPAVGLIGMKKTGDGLPVVNCVLGFAAVAFCSGQLCSMAFRSGIMAATFGTMLTIPLCGWAVLMHKLGLSWLWSVTPLPLAFLVVTRVSVPDWILERRGWRTWLRPVLVVAVPVLAILAAIPLVHVNLLNDLARIWREAAR